MAKFSDKEKLVFSLIAIVLGIWWETYPSHSILSNVIPLGLIILGVLGLLSSIQNLRLRAPEK